MNGLVGGLCVCNEKQRNYTAKMCTANSPDAVPLSGAEHCRAKWVNYSVRVCVYSSLCHLNLQSRNPLSIPFAHRQLSVLVIDRSHRKN